MPKYWGKQIFTHGRFPEVGQKQNTEKKKEKERERPKVGNNNDQLRIATPLGVAHLKPHGPKIIIMMNHSYCMNYTLQRYCKLIA